MNFTRKPVKTEVKIAILLSIVEKSCKDLKLFHDVDMIVCMQSLIINFIGKLL